MNQHSFPRHPRFSDLLQGLALLEVSGDLDAPVRDVSYDSREATSGGLFVAIPGGYVDGHEFLADALSRGATCALIERHHPALDGYRAWARVENTREALAPVAATFFRHPGASLGVIGVTGTDGKTTTSYLIDAMLRDASLTTGMVGTIAVRIANEVVEHDTRQTTPESLDVQRLLASMRASRVDWAILEATSHALGLYRLNECPFDIGVVTNITREHLEFHGTVERYREAKARLLERVRGRGDRRFPTGVVLNADDEGARAIAPARGNVPTIWYSARGSDAGLTATDIEGHGDGIRFTMRFGGDDVDVTLRLIGRFNVENALAAAGVGLLIGLSPDQIARGLGSLHSVPGRLERIDAGQPFRVFVDYAHSPAALQHVLALVRGITPGRVIAVSGSAGERDEGKRALQGVVSATYADVSIFTSEDPRFEDPDHIIAQISSGAREAGAMAGRDYFEVEDRRLAIEKALLLASDGDTVVLAGKGHEQCMIYGNQRRPWDEASEARLALASLGYSRATSAEEGTA